MNVAEQVEKQLNDEHQKFINKKYSGNMSIPANILEVFSIGIMGMPPFAHGTGFTKVKDILSKSLDELTNGDINDIIKVVWNVAPERVYDDIEAAIKGNLKIERFIVHYKLLVEECKRELQLKRARLMDLSGASGGMNGISIIK